MKKKGFTLIELLAVIVILAIITVIAVPKILDVIEKSRRSASEQSVKLYVDAFRLYQANAALNNTDKIPEGTYEVSKETTLNGKTYKKINDLLTMKGNKPSAGTINVTSTGKIGTAKVCINNYVISYQEGSTSILADDCGDMDLFVDFKINTDEWATEKTLIITYPEKQGYKKYFKVESGSVFIGEKEVTSESAQEVTEKEITLKLKENSKVSAWLEKNSKKAGISTYEEKKIDNEELVEPTITLTGSYPILTEYGVQMSVSLKLSNETNKASKIMYRVDNGEFKEYTGETNVTGSKIEAKTVKPNGRESSVVEKDMSGVEVATDAIGALAYDGDEETGFKLSKNGYYYMNVDKSVWNKNVELLIYLTDGYKYVYYYAEDGTKIKSITINYSSSKKTKVLTIPENTVKIGFEYGSTFYEIDVDSKPVINAKQNYPKITSSGVENGYNLVDVDFYTTSIKKLYKVDDSDWQEYKGSIKLAYGKKISVKGIDKNNKETKIAEYTSDIENAIGALAYDGDKETSFKLSKSGYYYMNVDKSVWNKNIELLIYLTDGYKYVYYYAEDGTKIKSITINYSSSKKTEVLTIPENTVRIGFEYGSTFYEIGKLLN